LLIASQWPAGVGRNIGTVAHDTMSSLEAKRHTG